MSLIGKEAPDFTVQAVVNGTEKTITLREYRGKFVILFFYPKDFTYVCPTELHAFQENLGEFANRQAVVLGCSVDTIESHQRWLNTERKVGGIQGVEYPLISDTTHSISKAYQVFNTKEELAYRGSFLIDKEGIIRHAVINDFPIGRSIEEELRTLDAWIFYENNGLVCPANWKQGRKGMSPDDEGLKEFFSSID